MLSAFEFIVRLAVIVLAVGAWFGLEVRCAHADDGSAVHHEPLIVVGDRIFVAASGNVAEIEDITRYCLGCHDGAIGPARQTLAQSVSGGGTGNTEFPGLHPLGVRYPDGGLKFNDLAMLPSSMYLSNGCVTCVSCHDLKREDHALVVSKARSGLCLTCHRK